MAEVLLRQKLIPSSNHFQLLMLLIQQSEKRVMLLTKAFDLITKAKWGCLYTMRLRRTRCRIQEFTGHH